VSEKYFVLLSRSVSVLQQQNFPRNQRNQRQKNLPALRSAAKIPELFYLGPSLFSLLPAVNLGNLYLDFSMNYEP
jgi:hypothetical protein